jgi:hypothetical protein
MRKINTEREKEREDKEKHASGNLKFRYIQGV